MKSRIEWHLFKTTRRLKSAAGLPSPAPVDVSTVPWSTAYGILAKSLHIDVSVFEICPLSLVSLYE